MRIEEICTEKSDYFDGIIFDTVNSLPRAEAVDLIFNPLAFCSMNRPEPYSKFEPYQLCTEEHPEAKRAKKVLFNYGILDRPDYVLVGPLKSADMNSCVIFPRGEFRYVWNVGNRKMVCEPPNIAINEILASESNISKLVIATRHSQSLNAEEKEKLLKVIFEESRDRASKILETVLHENHTYACELMTKFYGENINDSLGPFSNKDFKTAVENGHSIFVWSPEFTVFRADLYVKFADMFKRCLELLVACGKF